MGVLEAMNNHAMGAPRIYETTIDRAGLSLGAGSAFAGIIVVALVLLGGQRDLIALASAWAIGCLFSAIALTAVGGPLWLVMHVAGLRRARHAAMVGAATAMAIFVGAQTYGFGVFEMPVMDSRTWLYRWISALASSAVLASVAAAIALLMWRIAYRPRPRGER
jgi:hypothetical protein